MTLRRRGQYVQTWFDTGALGATLLYGVVIAAGPRTFTVRWESGLRNRIRQGDRRITDPPANEMSAPALAQLLLP